MPEKEDKTGEKQVVCGHSFIIRTERGFVCLVCKQLVQSK